jgi:hypothetical protein
VADRCRLCTTNDRDGLVESLAADLWDTRRRGSLDDRAWEQAGPYWQGIFRELAQSAVVSLEH